MTLIITTGGTIGMRDGVPAGGDFASFGAKVVSFANEPSTFFDSSFACKLANFIIENHKNYSQIIVTHGTDTLEETAFYLDLVLDISVPVVLTGAIHMQNELAYDGFANLQTAITAAKHLRGGVFVAFDSDIFQARFVSKTNPVSRRAFGSRVGLFASVISGRFVQYSEIRSRERFLKPAKIEKLALIKAHFDIDDQLIKDFVQNAKSVVLEGFGGGRIPRKIVELISEICQEKPVVIASTAFEANTGDSYAYVGGGKWATDQKLQVVYSMTDSKKTAIALGLAVANGLNISDIYDYFQEEIY